MVDGHYVYTVNVQDEVLLLLLLQVVRTLFCLCIDQ